MEITRRKFLTVMGAAAVGGGGIGLYLGSNATNPN
jgi:hypothetical protein